MVDRERASVRFPVGVLVTLLVGAPVGVLLVWPQAFGAQTALAIAQLVAFRGAVAIALGGVALVVTAYAVLRRRWSVAAGLTIVVGVAAIAQAGILLSRGFSDTQPPGDLTVLAWNTEGGATPARDVAQLILDSDADIVSLPETDAVAAARIAQLVEAGGRRMSVDTALGQTGYSSIPTSVLISDELGEYLVDDAAGSTPGLPSGVWRPVDGDGPIIVAAHPRPPIPSGMGQWRAGLDWVAARCDSPEVIVAGDLNATVDHMAGLGEDGAVIGACRDAAEDAGAAAIGTWPTVAPPLLGTPIDHVLFGSAWVARGVRVVTAFGAEGSDHRPIIAVLDRR